MGKTKITTEEKVVEGTDGAVEKKKLRRKP